MLQLVSVDTMAICGTPCMVFYSFQGACTVEGVTEKLGMNKILIKPKFWFKKRKRNIMRINPFHLSPATFIILLPFLHLLLLFLFHKYEKNTLSCLSLPVLLLLPLSLSPAILLWKARWCYSLPFVNTLFVLPWSEHRPCSCQTRRPPSTCGKWGGLRSRSCRPRHLSPSQRGQPCCSFVSGCSLCRLARMLEGMKEDVLKKVNKKMEKIKNHSICIWWKQYISANTKCICPGEYIRRHNTYPPALYTHMRGVIYPPGIHAYG